MHTCTSACVHLGKPENFESQFCPSKIFSLGSKPFTHIRHFTRPIFLIWGPPTSGSSSFWPLGFRQRECCQRLLHPLLSLRSLDENFPEDAICKLYVQVCLHACYLDTLFHLGWGWATKTLHGFAQHCYERIKPMMKIAPEISLRKITFLDMRLSVYYWPFFLTVEQRHTFTSISHGTLIHTHGVSILPHCFASPSTFSWLNYFLWGWIF